MRLDAAILLVKVRERIVLTDRKKAMSGEEESNWLDIPDVMLNISIKKIHEKMIFWKKKQNRKIQTATFSFKMYKV